MIKDEGTDLVLHQGDFDYDDDPDAWDQQINDILGPDFPYFISVGNHDTGEWDGYQAKFEARLGRIPEAQCSGDLGVKSTCIYKGFAIVLSGVGTMGSGHESYIQNQFNGDDHLWRICSWHKNMHKMQVGGKGDDTGWGVYEACREAGAIVATGHEHSYSRTYLMSSFENQVIANQSSHLVLEEGKSFAFVSGIAGKSIRDQENDWPWMAAVYTSDQNANHGALFCTYHDNGNPAHASCYFKDIDGEVPDQFELTSTLAGPAPTPTPTPTTTVTPPPTGDVTAPDITSFDVQPRTAEGPVQVDWSVSDGGGSHLARVQIWRAADQNGEPDLFSWHQRPALQRTFAENVDQASGSGSDNPPPGAWWYRLQVADKAGNWTFGSLIRVVQNGGGGGPGSFEPFGTVDVDPAFLVDGAGTNVDSIAFWEAPDPSETLMFVTAKGNDLVEVWKYPFQGQELPSIDTPHTANGVLVDQRTDVLYVAGGGDVSRYSLPDLQPMGAFGQSVGGGETNLALLYHNNGQTWLYVTSDHEVHIFNTDTGGKIGSFSPPVTSIETVWADNYHQIVYVPEEQGAAGQEGVYAYHPDGSPYERNGTNRFGNGPFEADEEGITIYTCPSSGSGDDGSGFIIVSDQKGNLTDFEFFNRETWEHLGALRMQGVSNTDGIASTQRPLSGYPLGLFAAIDDDTATAGVGWETVLEATGLRCGSGDPGTGSTFEDVPTNHWAFPYVEALYQGGFIAGCQIDPAPAYCPARTMTRAESAVFTARGVHGAGFLPPDPSEQIFADDPLTNWSAKWSAQLWEDGYTAGCGTNPLRYCPDRPNTIAEGSVFMLRMLNGPGYVPPTPDRSLFSDVPQGIWFEKWIMGAFQEGLITACRGGSSPQVCPNDPLNRAMAAYMMTVAKNLAPIE
jgi:hypothetical protein